MDPTKTERPWQSRTMWVNLIALVASMLLAFGVDLGLDGEAQASMVTLVMAGVNMYLRYDSTKVITLKEPEDPTEETPPTGV